MRKKGMLIMVRALFYVWVVAMDPTRGEPHKGYQQI